MLTPRNRTIFFLLWAHNWFLLLWWSFSESNMQLFGWSTPLEWWFHCDEEAVCRLLGDSGACPHSLCLSMWKELLPTCFPHACLSACSFVFWFHIRWWQEMSMSNFSFLVSREPLVFGQPDVLPPGISLSPNTKDRVKSDFIPHCKSVEESLFDWITTPYRDLNPVGTTSTSSF